MSDIFISFKYHNKKGEVTPDYHKAKSLCRLLREKDFDVFFSDDSIISLASSDYKKVIDENLESAKVLIVVSSSHENCRDGWVRYEWDSFCVDLLNGHKDGMLLSLISDNISEYPITLRNLQFFSWADDSVSNLVKMVSNFFSLHGQANQGSKNKVGKRIGSSYNYEVGDERKRLKIQAKLESEKDKEKINKLIGSINRPKINVLDVGCSMGTLTKLMFGDFGGKVEVLGVDKFEKCVNEFNETCGCDNFHSELLNFDESDWPDKLKRIMQERKIDKFDLVYCSMSLHHMADSDSVVKKLWFFIRNNGYIYVRTNDDNLKIAYPDPEGVVMEIIEAASSVPGMADRYHGRKIYQQLKKAKFVDIEIGHNCIDTVGKSQVERNAIFVNTFSWRKNYFVNYLNEAAKTGNSDMINDSLQKYGEICEKTDKVEEYFTDSGFYFAFFVTTAIGCKVDFIDEDQ